jgi:hypothetical protein
MKSFFRLSRNILPILLVLGTIFAFSACDQDVTLDLDKSVNIFHPGPKWPTVKNLTPAQKQIYETMGRPDCFHILYDHSGKIKMRQVLEKELNGKKPKNLPPYSWVYLKDKKEIVFEGNSYVERPLTETLLLVIQYGDPEDVRSLPDGVSQWTWYSAGKMYKIYNDKIIETKEFPAMGTFLK